MGAIRRGPRGARAFATGIMDYSGRARSFLIVAGLLSLSVALSGQSAQVAGSSQSSMKMHYDAAFRFQDAGDIPRADGEYKLYLSMVLHHVANGYANLGNYSRAVQLYEESLRLAPDDKDLKIDYASAALGGADWKRAKDLASSMLDTLRRDGQPPDAHAVAILAQALLEMGDHQEALRQFKLAAELHPTFDSSSQVAIAYLVLGDQESAAKILDELPKKYGDTAVLHLKLGRFYGNSKFFDPAIREFQKALAMDDHIRGAHYSIGASYMMQSGEPAYEKAEVEFRKELAINPQETLVYLPLGRINISRHLYAEAEADLKRAADVSPQSSTVYLSLGELYKDVGKAPEAEHALRKSIALTLDPSTNDYEVEQAHFWLGRILVEGGNSEEGRKELDIARKLLYLKEQQVESRLAGGSLVQISLDRTHSADPDKSAILRTFEKQSGPIIASSYSNLGANAANAGEYGNASSYFEQAAKWNPALPNIDESWGRAAFAAREYRKAVEPLSRTLARRPADAHVRAMLGLNLCLVHEYGRAVEVFRPIEETVNSIQELSIAYAGAIAMTSNSKESLLRVESLEQANSADPLVHYLLGEIHASRKEYSESADELRIALRLDPTNKEAKNVLADDDLALGQKPEALQILADLADSESESGEAHYRLARLQDELGMAGAAVGNLETAIRFNPNVIAYHQELSEAYRKNAQPEDAEREARQLDALQELRGSN